MTDTLETANNLKKVSKLAKEFSKSISRACGGSFECDIEQMVDSYISMYERFCPFEVDDRVELVEDVDTSDFSGWEPCKHFLVKGAKATVHDRGYRNGHFTFSVVFDDETWLKDGVPQPVIIKHTFGLSEHRLKKEFIPGGV